MSRNGLNNKGGRPKGCKSNHTLQAEQYRVILIKKILENAEPLAQALIDKGLEKDVPALREIHERSLGKVREELDLTSKGEKLVIYVPKKRTTDMEAQ